MKKKRDIRDVLRSVNHYIVFFLFMAFIITCCTTLFVTVLSRTMDLTLTEENLGAAAKFTFLNVVFLSLLCTVIDAVRRKITVERPVKQIINAAKRIMEGDFSVRIPQVSGSEVYEGFNEVIECFNLMAKELSGTETLRTDFIANVSHELKTPLTVIQNYGTMLQLPDLSEEHRMEYAKGITDASRRLASLITNILKLNKLENQQMTPSLERYDLGEQLCECLLNFEDIWEIKSLEIETDIDESVLVYSDREMTSLVWNNLFSNAIKFTEKGGRIGLSLKSVDGYAVVRISDTGCGISKEVGAHIFDKFYQGDTSHATQGNGLGLALVKRVVDLLGFDISVESEVCKGSTFTVVMKLAERSSGMEVE